MPEILLAAKERLKSLKGKSLSDENCIEEAIALASQIAEGARRKSKSSERSRARELQRMVSDRFGMAWTVRMSDRIFRSSSLPRCANQFRHLKRLFGIPRYFSFLDRFLLCLASLASHIAPRNVMGAVQSRIKSSSAAVILDARVSKIKKRIAKRKSEGFEISFNHIGEAVLGEEEAARRVESVRGYLESGVVSAVSIKVSSIFSQIRLTGYAAALDQISARLRAIFRAAMSSQPAAFVNLDMEEYRDLHLTMEAFQSVLDEEEFLKLKAGIALQAYLPESHDLQRKLTTWAKARVERGGVPIKLRIVKGANLAIEIIDAELHGWPRAPYESKLETDANFKRMVAYGSRAENAAVVNLGIASHSLFEIALALVLRATNNVEKWVNLEMLEGMANHQARALLAVSSDPVVLYSPAVENKNFQNALAYLIRRLDENTQKGNFLRDGFGISPNSKIWKEHEITFRESNKIRDTVRSWPSRRQNRSSDSQLLGPMKEFENAADTDWTLAANRSWLDGLLTKWESRDPAQIPLVIDGKELIQGLQMVDGIDPSRPGHQVYTHAVAGETEVETALKTAARVAPLWDSRPVSERAAILKNCAVEMAHIRGEAICGVILDTGKAASEADLEVSEAIDFANFYATAFDTALDIADCASNGRGPVLVVAPWNFPFAIPASGILAALMAGCPVIFKPAPQAVLVGWQLVNALWKAGVPKDVLQFLPCPENEVGRKLISDPRLGCVVLTGSLETAQMFQEWEPKSRLLAETSGKNSIIVTALADRDDAIRAIIHSAFSHSGQKCSAASLAILEAEVYDDPVFQRSLRDAAASLSVGSAWEGKNVVTPLIDPPGRKLKKALLQLEDNEEWLLEPRVDRNNPRLWSPGIKLAVQPGSFFHQTECFGPVLGLMRAKNLKHAVKIQNDVAFGLTAGLFSLDEREIRWWRVNTEAGNLYVNRAITGAIVRRQPFGGWKSSSIGPSAKTGGPNYVFTFCRFRQSSPTPDSHRGAPSPTTNLLLTQIKRYLLDEDERKKIQQIAWSQAWAWQNHFSKGHDPSHLEGEINVFRYQARRSILVRFNETPVHPFDVFTIALASSVASVPVQISLPNGFASNFAAIFSREKNITVIEESEDSLAMRLIDSTSPPELLRVMGTPSTTLLESAHSIPVPVTDDPVVKNGRIELRHWFREQSISQTRHRYGHVLTSRRK